MDNVIYNLNDYLKLLKENNLVVEACLEQAEKPVEYISYDSKDIRDGTLFICKGAHFKEDYLIEALKNGAFAYISEEKYQENFNHENFIIVNNIRKAMGILANAYYNQVWKKLNLIGITGTKGKSSTTYFMRAILDDYLEESGKPKSAIISGIDNYDGVILEESHITTPEAIMFHKHMDNARKSGIEYLTMEVSSQALKYDRTLDVIYDIGAFLNIGEDHISDIEHPSVKDYMESKLILFNQCKNAVINIDSDFYKEVLEAAKKGAATEKIVTFGENEDADFVAYDIRPEKRGIKFRVKSKDFDEEIEIGLTGLFNVSNALAAVVMSYLLGMPIKNIKNGLKKAKVSGRMEIFLNKDETKTVIVDYAHNQMSFQSLFESTKKEYPGKKIIIVYGCPGKKALGRRKELGDITGEYADLSILTEEDHGEESLIDICKEIASHIEEKGGKYEIILDREEAIKSAIDRADKDTVILITGKGRETRQKRGTEYIETTSDVEYVERFLKDK